VRLERKSTPQGLKSQKRVLVGPYFTDKPRFHPSAVPVTGRDSGIAILIAHMYRQSLSIAKAFVLAALPTVLRPVGDLGATSILDPPVSSLLIRSND